MTDSSQINPLQLAAFDPDAERTLEHTCVPRGGTIRIIQKVRDVTDGSIRSVYVAVIGPLPNGDQEATTLAEKADIVLEIWTPGQPSQKPAAKGRPRGRSKPWGQR